MSKRLCYGALLLTTAFLQLLVSSRALFVWRPDRIRKQVLFAYMFDMLYKWVIMIVLCSVWLIIQKHSDLWYQKKVAAVTVLYTAWLLTNHTHTPFALSTWLEDYHQQEEGNVSSYRCQWVTNGVLVTVPDWRLLWYRVHLLLQLLGSCTREVCSLYPKDRTKADLYLYSCSWWRETC